MCSVYNHGSINVNNYSSLTALNRGYIVGGMKYGERLRKARKHAGITQGELSSAMGENGCTQENISKLERGDADGSSFTVSFARICGVRAAWLESESGPMVDESGGTNVAETTMKTGLVPVISWVQAGEWSEAIDNYQAGFAEEWIGCTVEVRRHTFALVVVGDSMEPDFKEGMILIVEPDLEPLPNDYVIAKNGNNEVTFKQLTKDGADWYLKPLNPRYPIKPLGNSHIVGVVRESARKHR